MAASLESADPPLSSSPRQHVVTANKLKGHQGSVLCLDYNHPSSYSSSSSSSSGSKTISALLLSGSEDRTARLWDLRDPQCTRLRAVLCLATEGPVVSVAFDKNNATSVRKRGRVGVNDNALSSSPFARDTTVFLSSNNAVWEYDLRQVTTPVVVLRQKQQDNNSNTTATTCTTATDPPILFSAEDEINQVVVAATTSSSSGGQNHRQVVAAADDTGSIHLWKRQQQQQDHNQAPAATIQTTITANIPNTMMTTVAFRPHVKNALQLASGSTDGCVRLYDAGKNSNKLKLLDTVDMNNCNAASSNQLCNPPMVHHLSFSPSGRLLAAALGDGSIGIVKVDTRGFLSGGGTCCTTRLWDAHGGAVASVVFGEWSSSTTNGASRVDASDRLLCSAGNDGAIAVWDLGTSLCGRHAPLALQLQNLRLNNNGTDDSSTVHNHNSSVEEPKTLFAIQHGSKPNWMVSSQSSDPYFPSTLFVADTTNDITAYTLPLT